VEGITLMDMHDYGLELFARYRAAEMRAEAEHRRRANADAPTSPRPLVALGAALTWIEQRVLGVRKLLTSRSAPRASNQGRA
jgi:hypothetical protein